MEKLEKRIKSDTSDKYNQSHHRTKGHRSSLQDVLIFFGLVLHRRLCFGVVLFLVLFWVTAPDVKHKQMENIDPMEKK